MREQFAWRHYYWYLTNEGIQYLREFLHLPAEIVPATLKRQTRTETARPTRPKGEIFIPNIVPPHVLYDFCIYFFSLKKKISISGCFIDCNPMLIQN